jgi:hypothetical protein
VEKEKSDRTERGLMGTVIFSSPKATVGFGGVEPATATQAAYNETDYIIITVITPGTGCLLNI